MRDTGVNRRTAGPGVNGRVNGRAAVAVRQWATAEAQRSSST
ncbi:hypothetical protein SBD_2715 [Streptomyces bottropensis ATCC 25435]|uniref:Uncharacterized protein n=1 Tax=Streptomyces bottropensis ATCC 25435 TaxID=1054862 RepID=M3FR19_9ACTN|nr:hypothetical protein SBD_2715 [Streptomyces bottropensis ATCC 25435]